MKLLLSVIMLLSSLSLQANSSESVIKSTEKQSLLPSISTMEPSLSFLSLNQGTQLMSIAVVSKMNSWISLGLEGDLPINFEKQEQFYMTRLMSRFHIFHSINSIYLQTGVSLGFFNGVNGGDNFLALSGLLGYRYTFSNNWEFGGQAGLQAFDSRFEDGRFLNNEESFHSRISVVGAYRF